MCVYGKQYTQGWVLCSFRHSLWVFEHIHQGQRGTNPNPALEASSPWCLWANRDLLALKSSAEAGGRRQCLARRRTPAPALPVLMPSRPREAEDGQCLAAASLGSGGWPVHTPVSGWNWAHVSAELWDLPGAGWVRPPHTPARGPSRGCVPGLPSLDCVATPVTQSRPSGKFKRVSSTYALGELRRWEAGSSGFFSRACQWRCC